MDFNLIKKRAWKKDLCQKFKKKSLLSITEPFLSILYRQIFLQPAWHMEISLGTAAG